jgi:hypothetical protein
VRPAASSRFGSKKSSHADGLEDENRKLQVELAGLLEARRENDDTFVLSPLASRSAQRGVAWTSARSVACRRVPHSQGLPRRYYVFIIQG